MNSNRSQPHVNHNSTSASKKSTGAQQQLNKKPAPFIKQSASSNSNHFSLNHIKLNYIDDEEASQANEVTTGKTETSATLTVATAVASTATTTMTTTGIAADIDDDDDDDDYDDNVIYEGDSDEINDEYLSQEEEHERVSEMFFFQDSSTLL